MLVLQELFVVRIHVSPGIEIIEIIWFLSVNVQEAAVQWLLAQPTLVTYFVGVVTYCFGNIPCSRTVMLHPAMLQTPVGT